MTNPAEPPLGPTVSLRMPQSFEPVTTLVSAVIPAHSCEFELNNSEYDSTVICAVCFANIAGGLLTAHVSGEWLAGGTATGYVLRLYLGRAVVRTR